MGIRRVMVVAVVAVVALAVLIVALNRSASPVRPAAPNGPATVVNDYPVDALVGFEVSCRHQGGSVASCVCLIHGMENRYTYAQFQALVAADDPKAPEYAVVARDCAGR